MDDIDKADYPVITDVVRTEHDISSQKLVIERLAASKLDVSGAEMNLREMDDHLKLLQKNLVVSKTIEEDAAL